MRTGAYALSLLSAPFNAHVLEAVEAEPLSLIELRRAVGSPPQTTMRGQLRTLAELGVLVRSREASFPGPVTYALGPTGPELLMVARVLQRWLANAPTGSALLGTQAAKSYVKALVDGWSSAMVRALAARPVLLTEMNRVISSLNYPSLDRRLSAMRHAGLVDAAPGKGRGTPYTASPWLREATAPLLAASRWERRYAPERGGAVSRLDVEAALLLALPLLELDEDVEGTCRLAVQLGGSTADPVAAGVVAGFVAGRVGSCLTRLRDSAEAWVVGSTAAWTGALLDGESEVLELGGDCSLALTVLDGLRSVASMKSPS